MWIGSIGYEKASFADFIRTLREASVAAVLDVRDLPQSRRAGFSKRQLQAGLEEAGMRYVHLKGLGTPKEGRVAAQQRDYARFWEIVDRTLATPAAEADLEKAAEVARTARSCLLCYEADGSRWIVWSYDADRIAARAVRRGDEPEDWVGLYHWWDQIRLFLR